LLVATDLEHHCNNKQQIQKARAHSRSILALFFCAHTVVLLHFFGDEGLKSALFSLHHVHLYDLDCKFPDISDCLFLIGVEWQWFFYYRKLEKLELSASFIDELY
jgi:hypothetical protein